ncbi:tetratricopeptide repeat protein [Paenibacillus sanguinis]|uniref:tetratricopeptide repeat protein n=1 Tax=Paenibacillus sanguinis TaxID=225906 RepID=UPI00037B267B|nr:tetratricopeptide repeat protein [Paenibacillus sanguinis]
MTGPTELQQPSSLDRLYEQISEAISADQPELAGQLIQDSDPYEFSLFVQALYLSGYTLLAKEKLLTLKTSLLRRPHAPYLELAFIWADICYEEGRFDEAAPILEAIAEQSPHFAAARFGAAACQLRQAIARLERRVKLYHPPQTEAEKIAKYIEQCHDMLELVQESDWRVCWSGSRIQTDRFSA